VHLEGICCDGACQAMCLLYWNEAWLRRIDDQAADRLSAGTTQEPPKTNISATLRMRQVLIDATRAQGGIASNSGERYTCKATELMRAAPTRLPW
jgi:hypothetical protein